MTNIKLMKHKTCLLVLAAMMMACSTHADSKTAIALAELPQAAQEIISTYFVDQTVAYITMEKDWLDVEYEVRMQNGTELDFDKQGLLQSVDMQMMAIPEGLVPELIKQYVVQHFPQAKIVKYSNDTRKQEIKLDNGLELEFDKTGQFLRLDD